MTMSRHKEMTMSRDDQRNVNKNKAFKIKLAVTMTSPEERKN